MYIKRKQALETINRLYETRVKRGCYSSGEALSECVQEVMAIPAADVVKVVRCKDCSHRPFHRCTRDNLWHDEDDFCSYGERKEQK